MRSWVTSVTSSWPGQHPLSELVLHPTHIFFLLYRKSHLKVFAMNHAPHSSKSASGIYQSSSDEAYSRRMCVAPAGCGRRRPRRMACRWSQWWARCMCRASRRSGPRRTPPRCSVRCRSTCPCPTGPSGPAAASPPVSPPSQQVQHSPVNDKADVLSSLIPHFLQLF